MLWLMCRPGKPIGGPMTASREDLEELITRAHQLSSSEPPSPDGDHYRRTVRFGQRFTATTICGELNDADTFITTVFFVRPTGIYEALAQGGSFYADEDSHLGARFIGTDAGLLTEALTLLRNMMVLDDLGNSIRAGS